MSSLPAVTFCLLACVFAGDIAGTGNKHPYRSSAKEVVMTLKEGKKHLPPPSPSVQGHYSHAAVSTDAQPCARVAMDVLREGGGAADAAVAGLLCVGVINPQSMGLGGGFLLTYYHRASSSAFTLDARETAPARAFQRANKSASLGARRRGATVGVPGELRGYQELYRRFGGRAAWPRLVEPARRLCREGHGASWHLAHTLAKHSDAIIKEPSMRVFVNLKEGRVVREGERVRRPRLADTLAAIQEHPDALYTGSLGRALVQDIQGFGGTIEEEDLQEYRPVWREPVRVTLRNSNLTVFSSPPPGCGVIVGLVLNVLDQYNVTPLADCHLTHHSLVEAIKWAYGQKAHLADPAFVNTSGVVETLSSHAFAKNIQQMIEAAECASQDHDHYGMVQLREDHGTSHFSLLAANGDAVSATSSINTPFGARLRSEQTGVTLNSVMLDFSPGEDDLLTRRMNTHKNKMQPGKRPRSSMSPTVVVDGGGQVRLVVGASGGSRIPAAVAQVAARALWFPYSIKEAIDDPRVYVGKNLRDEVYEEHMSRGVYESLRRRGHRLREVPCSDCTVVNAILVTHADADTPITANADFRKRGDVDGY